MRALVVSALALHANAESSPIGKVLGMISDLEATIIKEGEVVQKEYAEFAEWCEDRSSNLGNEIKTGKADVADLKASIAKEEATIALLQNRVAQNGGDIATDQHDLKAATEIRTKEAANFAAQEQELMETIDMLERAIGILE